MKCLLFFLILSSTSIFAMDIGTRGGGDTCEDRIKDVRDDLNKWIINKGPNGLTLPEKMTVSFYSEAMLFQISKAKIECVGKSDERYSAGIEGISNVCRFDLINDKSFIKCDFFKFNSLSESEQYVRVHHQFAGLAGIENDLNDSVSNQISAYLVDDVVKKLAIRPIKKAEDCTKSTLESIHVHEEKLFRKEETAPLDWILELFNSCKTKAVKYKTMSLFAIATSNADLVKTYYIVDNLQGFCRDDITCAMTEINLLSSGISARSSETSPSLIRLITKIVTEDAPYEAVKNKAISVLSGSCLRDPYLSIHCTLAIQAINSVLLREN